MNPLSGLLRAVVGLISLRMLHYVSRREKSHGASKRSCTTHHNRRETVKAKPHKEKFLHFQRSYSQLQMIKTLESLENGSHFMLVTTVYFHKTKHVIHNLFYIHTVCVVLVRFRV